VVRLRSTSTQIFWFGCIWLVSSTFHLVAQDTKAPESSPVQQEITVTAEIRETTKESLAMTIDVIDGSDAERRGITTALDLGRALPNLFISNNGTYGQAFLRGVGTDTVAIGAESSVAMYVDGVYRPRPTAMLQELLDLERIEVLAGPQGALYGRNATGGAINLITRPVVLTRESAWSVTAGNYQKQVIRGSYGTPLAAGRAAARVSFVGNHRTGHTVNHHDDFAVDGEDAMGIRGKLGFFPSGALTIELSLEAVRDDSIRYNAPGLVPEIHSPARDDFGGSTSSEPRSVFFDTPITSEIDARGFVADISRDLAHATLVSITAIWDDELANQYDVDATDIPFGVTRTALSSRTRSQELRLVSRDAGPHQWIAGFHYFDEDAAQDTSFDSSVVGLSRFTSTNRVTAAALYGQLDWSFGKLTLTGGLRYSYEEKHHTQINRFPDPTGNSEADGTRDWDDLTPRLGMRYQTDRGGLGYLTIAKGFKSGGFNSVSIRAGDHFEPESLWSYEVGWKGKPWNGKLRTVLAAFHYDYEDLQVNLYQGGTAVEIVNAATAVLNGLELDLGAELAPGLALELRAMALDATYRDYNDGRDERGDARLPRAPELALNLDAHHHHDLGEGRRISTRLGYRYQSEIYFNAREDPRVGEGAVSTLEARIDFEVGPWRIGLFGRNLTDETYLHNVTEVPNLLGGLAYYDDPRFYGIEMGFVSRR